MGLEGWGRLLAAQSLAAGLAVLAEFGFLLSVARRIPHIVTDRESMASEAAAVMGGRMVLTPIVIAIGLFVGMTTELFSHESRLVAAAIILG